MAPTVPTKRRSMRAKLASKAGEPHAPRKAPRPDAVAPPDDLSSSLGTSKRDRRAIRHSALVSRIEKTHAKPAKRRRPGKKLVANLEGLADALPDFDDEDNGGGVGSLEERVQRMREGRVRKVSLGSKKGALKRKERVVRAEMSRFGGVLAILNEVGAGGQQLPSQHAEQGQGMEVETADAQTQASTSTASRWAALRGFISSTMEQNPAFAAKESGK
ncbi:ribosome biogenesis protein SLX9-domain-containing protein [Xylariaceae sp. FL0016]|nr:ribosome biogenesis protein SLX9-domain-containing protein [Xylariaceae sp. FL0016]